MKMPVLTPMSLLGILSKKIKGRLSPANLYLTSFGICQTSVTLHGVAVEICQKVAVEYIY